MAVSVMGKSVGSRIGMFCAKTFAKVPFLAHCEYSGGHMGSDDLKLEISGTFVDVPSFLRELAAHIEQAPDDVKGRLAEDDFAKLRVGLKRSGPHYKAKLKVKFPPRRVASQGAGAGVIERVSGAIAGLLGDAECSAPHCKYATLKKRMKGPWRTLREISRTGGLPPVVLLETFVADSRLMVAYDGKGDAYYAPYLARLEEMVAAFKAEDAQAFATAVQGMERVVSECHSVYK